MRSPEVLRTPDEQTLFTMYGLVPALGGQRLNFRDAVSFVLNAQWEAMHVPQGEHTEQFIKMSIADIESTLREGIEGRCGMVTFKREGPPMQIVPSEVSNEADTEESDLLESEQDDLIAVA